jgi:hypothetical protein
MVPQTNRKSRLHENMENYGEQRGETNKSEMQYFFNISLIFHSSHTEKEELMRYVPTYLVVSFLSHFSLFLTFS